MSANYNEIHLLEELAIKLQKWSNEGDHKFLDSAEFVQFLKSSKDTLIYLGERELSLKLESTILEIIEAINYINGKCIGPYLTREESLQAEQILRNKVNPIITQINDVIAHIYCSIKQRKSLVEEEKQSYLAYLDKAIETTLKEYETLRNEILQDLQNRSQIILLGLAAIFTIAGLSLSPLTNLLTSETTTIQTNINYEIKDTNTGSIILNSLKPNSNYGEIAVERATNENTIKSAIIPIAVVSAWIIPLINIYVIYRTLNWTQKILQASSYITNVIESRVSKLFHLKFRLKSPYKFSHQEYKDTIMNLSWESYMSKISRSRDITAIILVCILFFSISVISFLGANILLVIDYTKEGNNGNDFYYPQVIQQISNLQLHDLINPLSNLKLDNSIPITILIWILITVILLFITGVLIVLTHTWNNIDTFILRIERLITFIRRGRRPQQPQQYQNQIRLSRNWIRCLRWIIIFLPIIVTAILIFLPGKNLFSLALILLIVATIIVLIYSFRQVQLTTFKWTVAGLYAILIPSWLSTLQGEDKIHFLLIILPFLVIIATLVMAIYEGVKISNMRKTVEDELKDNYVEFDGYIQSDENNYFEKEKIAREYNGLTDVKTYNGNVNKIDILTLRQVIKVTHIDQYNQPNGLENIKRIINNYLQVFPNHQKFVFISGVTDYNAQRFVNIEQSFKNDLITVIRDQK